MIQILVQKKKYKSFGYLFPEGVFFLGAFFLKLGQTEMKTVCFVLLNEILNKILNYQIYDLFFTITKKFNERFNRFLYFFIIKTLNHQIFCCFQIECGSGPFCVEKFIFGLFGTS